MMLLRGCLLMFVLLCVPGCGASYVPCQTCDSKALSLCPPVPLGCQLVKEPGCGCCLTCALEEGGTCGVYTGPCARGLRCLPKNGEEKPLHALLHGRGVCRSEKLYKVLHPANDPTQIKVPLYGDHIDRRKAQALRQAKDRKNQLARPGPSNNRDLSPPSLDKLEPEFGPCRRELDSLIKNMKNTSQVLAISLYIPNCDKKGFFKHKQCKPSKGRKRGICWCVDRFGNKIPRVSYTGRDLQCKDLENNSNE